jgi:hypothetical protein
MRLPLSALVEIEHKELEEAHASNAAYGYNCPPPTGYTVEEWNALNAECAAILKANGGFKWRTQ